MKARRCPRWLAAAFSPLVIPVCGGMELLEKQQDLSRKTLPDPA